MRERLANLEYAVSSLNLKKCVCGKIVVPKHDCVPVPRPIGENRTYSAVVKEPVVVPAKEEKSKQAATPVKPVVVPPKRAATPVKPVVVPPPERVAFPCDRCKVVCRSSERLANHRKDCKIIGESAFPSDFHRTVKTAPFLGARKTSPKRNMHKSGNTSTMRDPTRPSPSREETLSLILKSQQSMQKSFEKFLQVMGGQNSATTPK